MRRRLIMSQPGPHGAEMTPRVAAVLALLLALWASFHLGQRSGASRFTQKWTGEEQGVFVLAVGLKFKSIEDRDKLLRAWQLLEKHTRTQEPGSISYKWNVADNDPTKVLVFERYINKEAYIGVHKHSQPYFAFKEVKDSMDIEITGQSYLETEAGFM